MHLYDSAFLLKNLSSFKKWERKAYMAFAEKLSHKTEKFPCIPATLGHRLGHLRYAFLQDPSREETRDELANLIRHYGEISRETGKYSSLIVFFSTVQAENVSDYFDECWSLLSALHQRDMEEWPEHIPPEPHDNQWEFCFHKEQYFMYCATPAHIKRQSRSFPCMMLAITPRWVIEEFNETRNREQVRENIRKRLAAYDDIEPHADLNMYGDENNYEWKQYFLSDDHQSPGKCPFEHLWKQKKS